MVRRRSSIRPRPQVRRFSLELLERRDCPAVIGIAGPAELNEAGAPVTLVATLSEPQSRPVTVQYFTTGSAKAGSDYGLAIGSQLLRSPTGSFTFPPGTTSLPITVTPRNDAAREGHETFQFTLAAVRGHTLGPKTAAVTLVDDDSYTASIVGPARVSAGVEQSYTLQLSAPATRMETFFVSTTAGTASSLPTADDPTPDYFPLTNLPLVFRPGETAKTFRVQTVASAAGERDQFFVIQTTPASADFGRVDPFGVTIAGNAPAPVPTVSVADVVDSEGNARTTPFGFVVSLSAPTGLPVTVTYATRDGTATTADNDYEAKSGTVTIAPGETSTTVNVNAVGDTKQEPDETFSLMVTSATNATIANASGTATLLNDESAFTIVVVFPDNSLTAVQQRAFRVAANRWSRIITGDVPDVPFQGRTIDDVEISATAPFIDGPGRVLGQAGPTGFRQTGSKLPFTGIMEFDSADLVGMENEGTLTSVILHEMGHVLGLGTLWELKNLVTGVGTTDPRYTGVNALREYRHLTGDPTAPSIPVENKGGPGTAGGHWRESVFDTELMTGFAEPPGVAMPISRMTVGALEDLGYTVNFSAADPYTIPSALQSPAGFVTGARTSGNLMALTSLPPGFFAAFAATSAEATAGTGKPRVSSR